MANFKISVTRNKKAYNEFTLTVKGTAGWMLTIQRALEMHAQHSPVAQDVLCFLKEATVDEKGKDILTV